MKLTQIKTAQVFRFENHNQSRITTIYIEPLKPGTGRVTVFTGNKVFTRYLDGCNPNIFTFLSRQDIGSFCTMFDLQYPCKPGPEYAWELVQDNEPGEYDPDNEHENPEDSQYNFLMRQMEPIWDELKSVLSLPFTQ